MVNLNGPFIRFSKIVKYLHSRQDAVDAIKTLENEGCATTSTSNEQEALSAATSCLHVHELKEVLTILKIRTLHTQTKSRMIDALKKAMRTRRTLFGTKLPLGSVLKRTIGKHSDMLVRLDKSLCKSIRLCAHRYYLTQDPSLWEISIPNNHSSCKMLRTRPHPFGLLERFGKISYTKYAIVTDKENRVPFCLASQERFEMYLAACEVRIMCEKLSTESSSKDLQPYVVKKIIFIFSIFDHFANVNQIHKEFEDEVERVE